MNDIRAPKRSLAGLVALVFAAVVAQSASANISGGQYRYHEGQWILQQRYQPVAKATAKQYRYHEGQWVLVASGRLAKVTINASAVRPDDRTGIRGIG